MHPTRYFDHAATTPLATEVLEAMLPWLREGYGNAHSLHSLGRLAGDAVERAREEVALAIGAEDPAEVVFTSGATEACNLALHGFGTGVYSPFEHSAVRNQAEASGFRELAYTDGRLIADGSAEVEAVMVVNNETGQGWEPTGAAPVLFRDATQALGKQAVDPTGWDLAAFSAHKLYGPKGVGALWHRYGRHLEPLVRGGDQEQGLRGGTLNVPAIVGFGVAARLAVERLQARADQAHDLRAVVLEELDDLSDWRVAEGPEGVPHILSISFLSLEGETLVLEADAGGFAVSAGAACSSGSTEPSQVLLAQGYAREWARGTVRISFGDANTPEAARDLGRLLRRTAERLRA